MLHALMVVLLKFSFIETIYLTAPKLISGHECVILGIGVVLQEKKIALSNLRHGIRRRRTNQNFSRGEPDLTPFTLDGNRISGHEIRTGRRFDYILQFDFEFRIESSLIIG